MKKILIITSSLLLASTSLLSNDKLQFCLYTSDKPTSMVKKFNPVVNHIQSKINKEIDIKIYPDYDLAIDAISNSSCDFTRMGPASYILSKRKNENIKVLAMENKKGSKTFNGVFIVPNDSDIKNLSDFKGKTFAFGNDKSTIGRFLSQEKLLQAGITSKDLKEFKYLGRHDKVALAVALKKYDGGVVKDSTFKKYKNKGIKELVTFKNVTKPWIASSKMDEKTFSLIKNTLLDLKDKKVLKSLKVNGFFESSDKDYDFVRNGMNNSLKF